MGSVLAIVPGTMHQYAVAVHAATQSRTRHVLICLALGRLCVGHDCEVSVHVICCDPEAWLRIGATANGHGGGHGRPLGPARAHTEVGASHVLLSLE